MLYWNLKHHLRADIIGYPIKEGGHSGEAVRDSRLAAGRADERGNADEVATLVDEWTAWVTAADSLAVTWVDTNLKRNSLNS